MDTQATGKPTRETARRYDRLAPIYDWMEWLMERSAFKEWRRALWSRLSSGRVLEVGVGTGKNIEHYPRQANVTAIDVSPGMLARAERRARSLGSFVDLRYMDVQKLPYPDNSFDAAVATFVFCSVPDPVQGLRELGRIVRPGGHIWLLEHVRAEGRLGVVMDVLNPLVVRIMGANINRRTVENVRRAGLSILEVEGLRGEMVKLIHAQPQHDVSRRHAGARDWANQREPARAEYEVVLDASRLVGG